MIRVDKPRLTAEEEAELGRRARAGDVSARNELVERNLGLVDKIVRHRRAEAHDHVWSAGYLGLIKGADTFDPEAGTRFSTHACQAIAWYIHNARCETWLVQTPRQPRSKELIEAVERVRNAECWSIDRDGENRGYMPDYSDPWAATEHEELLAGVLAAMNDRERLAVSLRFGLDGQGVRRFDHIGVKLGITKQGAEQLVSKTIERLRRAQLVTEMHDADS